MGETLYDLSQLRVAAHGDDHIVCRLIQVFLKTTPKMLSEMEEAMQNSDMEKVEKIAHKLKTSFDTMDLAVKKEIREVERLAKAGEKELIAELIMKINNILKEVFLELSKEPFMDHSKGL